MRAFISKILTTPNVTIPLDQIQNTDTEIIEVGKQIERSVGKIFKGSLAIRQVDAGSDNAVEQELVALSNPIYDIERFGIHFVASPRHADMLIVTGPVTRNMAEALKRAHNATPNPKLVVAVGDDAIDGGIYKDSYAVYGGVGSTIPVDFSIPGDPPSPLEILRGLLQILDDLSTRGKTK